MGLSSGSYCGTVFSIHVKQIAAKTIIFLKIICKRLTIEIKNVPLPAEKI
jgi:hypothetical protein